MKEWEWFAIKGEIVDLMGLVFTTQVLFSQKFEMKCSEMIVHPSWLPEGRKKVLGVDVKPGPTGYKNVVMAR